MTLHKLLLRQLRRQLGLQQPGTDLPALLARLAEHPDAELRTLAERLPSLLGSISEAYRQQERDLALRTRILALSSDELHTVNQRLRDEALAQTAVLQRLRDTSNQLLHSIGRPPLSDTGLESHDLLRLTDVLHELVTERERAQAELAANEAKFRSLLSNLPGCVYRCRVDARASVVYVSQGIEALCGLSAEQMMADASGLLELMHPDDQLRARQEHERAFLEQRAASFEFRLRSADGSYRWALNTARIAPACDAQGGLLIDGVVMDTHALKQAQQEAAEARQQLVDAIGSLDAGFAMFDADERLLICNQRFRDFYPSLSPLLIPGTPVQQLMRAYGEAHPEARGGRSIDAFVAERLERFRRMQPPPEVYTSGRWLRVDDTRTASGQSVWLRTDISDIRQLNLDLTAARDAAESALRAKRSFLANMSHEIRTPLNGILGLTELAQHTQSPQELQETLALVHDSGHSLLRIVNDVLDYSKIEAGMLRLERISFSPSAWLNDSLQPFAVQARAKGLRFEQHLDPELPPLLEGDPSRLRQVLSNLVGNALKFTPRGHVSVRLLRDGADRWALEVDDSGEGIPQAFRERLFQPFTQADDSTTRRYGGTGLGLSICKHLVNLMDGQLQVDSEPGRGSRFRADFPLQTAAAAPTVGTTAPASIDLQWQRLEVLDRLGNDTALLNELMQMLRHELQQRLPQLDAALQAQDAVALGQHAHRIAGAAANLSVQRLHTQAKTLQTLADLHDWQRIATALNELRTLAQAVDALPLQGPRPA